MADAGGLKPKISVLLEIIHAAGGTVDSSDYGQGSWLNYFCEPNLKTDTFNEAEQLGYIRTSHDTSFDTSTSRLTDKGREAIRSLSSPSKEGE